MKQEMVKGEAKLLRGRSDIVLENGGIVVRFHSYNGVCLGVVREVAQYPHGHPLQYLPGDTVLTYRPEAGKQRSESLPLSARLSAFSRS